MTAPLLSKIRNDTRRTRRLLAYKASTNLARIRAMTTRYRRRDTTLIAVTGSSGKSTAVALINHILSAHAPTKAQFLRNDPRAVVRALAAITPGTRFGVFELAIGPNADMGREARLLKPHVALITMIALEHRSIFKTVEAVIAEKGKLIKALRPDGTAVVNADNEGAMAMVKDSPARKITFGYAQDADYRLLSVQQTEKPSLQLTLQIDGNSEAFEFGLVGKHTAPTLAGAVATAHSQGVSIETIRQQALTFSGVRGRMEVYRTEHGPTFILDTIKAPYHSIVTVLESFGELPAPRRIAIIGNISDYGGTPKTRYRIAREAAMAAADVTIFVGRMHRRCGATDEEIKSGRFIGFDTVEQADAYLKANARQGDLILLKSARGYHLDRLAFSWRTGVLCWLENCGVQHPCRRCGRYLPIFGNEFE